MDTHGLRLRHVPDEVRAQVELGKASARKAPTNKSEVKPSKPLTYEQVKKRVTTLLKDGVSSTAPAIITALGAAKIWERYRPRLLADRVIVARGEHRKMTYSLAGKE